MKKIKKIDYIMCGSILAMLNLINDFVNVLLNKFNYTSNSLSIIISILPFVLVFIGIFKKEQKNEIHTKKTTVVLLSIILFSLVFFTEIALEAVLFYGFDKIFNNFVGFLPTLLPKIFISHYSVLAFILFIYGMCLNKTKKKTTKKEYKRKKVWIASLVINLLVFIATLIYCICDEWFIVLIYLCSPILAISLILTVISIVKIKKYK